MASPGGPPFVPHAGSTNSSSGRSLTGLGSCTSQMRGTGCCADAMVPRPIATTTNAAVATTHGGQRCHPVASQPVAERVCCFAHAVCRPGSSARAKSPARAARALPSRQAILPTLRIRSKPEHHQDHILPELGRFRKRPFVAAAPAASDQGHILFAVDRISHWRTGECGAGLEAPQLLHGVLIEGRYLAHDVAHEDEAAVGAQYARIGRIIGLELLHSVAGAHIDAAEQAVA